MITGLSMKTDVILKIEEEGKFDIKCIFVVIFLFCIASNMTLKLMTELNVFR